MLVWSLLKHLQVRREYRTTVMGEEGKGWGERGGEVKKGSGWRFMREVKETNGVGN